VLAETGSTRVWVAGPGVLEAAGKMRLSVEGGAADRLVEVVLRHE
jgi:hypothetical protein